MYGFFLVYALLPTSKPFILQKLLGPSREWIFHGPLRAVCGRMERAMWLFLFSDILCYSHSDAFLKVARKRRSSSGEHFRQSGRNTWGPSSQKRVSLKANHEDVLGKVALEDLWITSLRDTQGTPIPPFCCALRNGE
jgi:hypothetical protein